MITAITQLSQQESGLRNLRKLKKYIMFMKESLTSPIVSRKYRRSVMAKLTQQICMLKMR